jgi:hypothetical protein
LMAISSLASVAAASFIDSNSEVFVNHGNHTSASTFPFP